MHNPLTWSGGRSGESPLDCRLFEAIWGYLRLFEAIWGYLRLLQAVCMVRIIPLLLKSETFLRLYLLFLDHPQAEHTASRGIHTDRQQLQTYPIGCGLWWYSGRVIGVLEMRLPGADTGATCHWWSILVGTVWGCCFLPPAFALVSDLRHETTWLINLR